MRLRISEARQVLSELRMHRVFQTLANRLAERSQRVDECVGRLEHWVRARLHSARQNWLRASAGVTRYDFKQYLRLKHAGLRTGSNDLAMNFSGFSRNGAPG